MQKEDLKTSMKNLAEKFLEISKDKEILIISHFDTDGITSASILIKTLKKLDKKFSVKIIKSLEKYFIETLPKNKIIFFLDLASGSLDYIKELGFENVFLIDHHEISEENQKNIPENVYIVNPFLGNKEKISTSGLVYFFSKEINPENKEFAKLAVLGMIGDQLEKEIGILNDDILEDTNIKKRRGLLIYPSTRPLNRTLEYSSQPYIPGVTGEIEGVRELLRECGITPINGKYKSLIELNENEMQKLVTAIMLRNPKSKNRPMIGDIFLIKLFNKLEDARELSAMINACSRLGESNVALRFCMEIPHARRKAEEIHVKYKQHLISGLEFAKNSEKIKGKDLIIINAKDEIKDTIIGTIASILSNSPLYDEGTIIITMAYYENKIKISARICGTESNGKNLKELLERVIKKIDGEVGGHEFAAGGIIEKEKEERFIEDLKKACEIEVVKI